MKRKTTFKLIFSSLLLFIALALSVSTTYAWFSMNQTVTVSNIEVSVTSDSTYLLISTTNTTASAIQAENNGAGVTSINAGISEAIFPSRPALSSTEAGYLSVAAGHYKTDGNLITVAGQEVDTAAKAETVTNWYTANGASPNASTINASTVRQLSSFTDYVIQLTMYVTVAAGANSATNLTVTPNITQLGAGSDISATKVLVVSGSNYVILSSSDNGTALSLHDVSNQTITDSTVITINIYIYYDGADTNVYTNNMDQLTGAGIELAFGVDVVSA